MEVEQLFHILKICFFLRKTKKAKALIIKLKVAGAFTGMFVGIEDVFVNVAESIS